tara:strand:+ start:123 stop:365 length:243 start_codon:yes stop_codon:yes gene_type:complete
MKVIFDMPVTMKPEVKIELLFNAFNKGLITKWDVYPICAKEIAANTLTRTNVKKLAKRICNINSGVIDMRLNDLQKMEVA